MKDKFSLRDKTVILTGAAGGIGFAIAKSLAEQGAKMVLIDSQKSLIKICTQEIKNTEYKPFCLILDITKEITMKKAVDRVMKKWGRVDVLINCAGVNVRKRIDKYTGTDWDRVMRVNLKAAFQLTNIVSKVMKKQKYGRVINIASIQAQICWNGKGKFSLAPYCASKAGLVSITKAFALDLAPFNITVNAICPAFVDTELVRVLKEDKVLYEDIISRTPLGRFAKTSEIVGPVIFLASDASSFITGHALFVDGGWLIQ